MADGVGRNVVERNFRDSKSEAGMADYQTCGWLAWHHHMALVMLALLFLAQERMHTPAPATQEGPINITGGASPSFWSACCPGAARVPPMRRISAGCWSCASSSAKKTRSDEESRPAPPAHPSGLMSNYAK